MNATVQLFLLRKNGYGVTDPKIKELFPEMNVNTTTLKPWLTIVNGVLVSEKEDKSAKGKGYGYAEEKNQDDSEGTEYDSSGKSVYKRHRMVGGVLNTPSRTLDLICCVDNAGTGTQASIWANTEHKQVRSH